MKHKATAVSESILRKNVLEEKLENVQCHAVGVNSIQKSVKTSLSLHAADTESTLADDGELTKSGTTECIVPAQDDLLLASLSKVDTYLLQDAEYLKIPSTFRWKNKQRTLLFCSRGIKHRERHFLEDLKKILPHHKTESKWEKKEALHEINELCELLLCNNVVFMESRKTELFMWVGRSPHGPSVKFGLYNLHTLGELKLSGNCLLYSRPLLVFDNVFSQLPFLKVIRELFIQVFGTPRNHPKSKPFHDHALCWYYHDSKIWFRHYEISPVTISDPNRIVEKPEQQNLTEIGPRFVMDPIKILEECFQGKVVWKSPHYASQTELRVRFKEEQAKSYAKRRKAVEKHKKRTLRNIPKETVVTNETVFGEDHETFDSEK